MSASRSASAEAQEFPNECFHELCFTDTDGISICKPEFSKPFCDPRVGRAQRDVADRFESRSQESACVMKHDW